METALIEVNDTDNSIELRKWESHIKPYLSEIQEMVRKGYTEGSIAKHLGICIQTWINYKKSQIELMEAITHGRRERFQLMKYQQYQKACGMTVVLNKQKVLKDGTIVNITEEQYIPPDTNAAEFVSRHDDPDYIPPKAEQSNNNAVVFFQLPQIQAEINKIRDELKSLETVEVKVIE